MAGSAVRYGQFTLVRFIGGQLMQRDPGTPNTLTVQRLVGIKRRALDLSPPFRAFMPEMYAQERAIFAAEGLPVAWPRLSPLYEAYKSRRWPGKTILRRTDRLHSSLTSSGGDNVAQAAPRTLRFGTTVPYWKYHQLGTSRMPARQPLVLLPETFGRLNQVVMRYVTEGLA